MEVKQRSNSDSSKLEGAQRVHISTKYTIMLWCTRLHVYISTTQCTCAVDASPANDNDVINNDGCGVTGVFLCGKIHLKRCWHFCTFLHNPHFDFEPDYVIRKPRKRRFQRYIVRTEIFSTFHAWVEYISVKTVIRQIDLPTPRAAMTLQSIYRLRTDRIKHHSISRQCSLRSLGGYNDSRCLHIMTSLGIRTITIVK